MTFKTVKAGAQIEYVIQKSRFIGHCHAVSTQEQALEVLAGIRKKYQDASHNCFAYRVRENNYARYSDDGEPGGTAGMPIMEVLRAKGIEDCIVVVTRYFGGILLGAGGLVRAYSKAAAMALDAAGVCEFAPFQTYIISVGYASFDKLESFLRSSRIEYRNPDFTHEVTIEAFVPVGATDNFENKLNDNLNGKIAYTKSHVEFRHADTKKED